jgi:hypothetical protein
VLEGPLTLKQLELSLRDLNTEWFLGSKSDVRSAVLAERVLDISALTDPIAAVRTKVSGYS